MKTFLLCLLCCSAGAIVRCQTPVLVRDIYPGIKSGMGDQGTMFVWNGKMYFRANDSVHGLELWSYDEKSSPKMAFDFYKGPKWGMEYVTYATKYCDYRGKLFMKGNDSLAGHELIAYDGVSAPVVVADISPGGLPSSPMSLTSYGGRLFFSAEKQTISASEGRELYNYDGVNPPVRIRINTGANIGGSDPRFFFQYLNKFYFSARPGATDYIIYTLDTAGAYAPAPGTAGFTDPGPACVTQGKVYFSAKSLTHGRELWSYDGTSALRLTDLAPGTASGVGIAFMPPVLFNGKIYFPGTTSGSTYQLYAFDPGTSGTTLVDATSLGDASNISLFSMIAYNNSLYYTAYTALSGYELWRYDGSACSLYADIIPGSDSSFYSREGGAWSRIDPGFTEFNGHLYFRARDKSLGIELWRIGNIMAGGVQKAGWDGDVAVRPNPAGSVTLMDITLQRPQNLGIFITDVSGRQVYNNPNKDYSAGKNTISLPVAAWPSGPYFYHLTAQDGNTLVSGKIVHE